MQNRQQVRISTKNLAGGKIEYTVQASKDSALRVISSEKLSSEKLSMESLGYIVQQHLRKNHRGRFPKRMNETIEIPSFRFIE